MLTLTLRALERDGLVTRTVFPTIPPRVDYELTRLGRSLLEPVSELGLWARQNRPAIQDARRRFDATPQGRRPASNPLDRNVAEKIALADIGAGMAQDRVSRRGVKIEIRQHEVIEILVALHLPFFGRPERKSDFAVG